MAGKTGVASNFKRAELHLQRSICGSASGESKE